MYRKSWPGFVALVLVAATLFLYWPANRFGFVYDDLTYILGDTKLRQGVTPAGISWAFTAIHAANWYPLTLISHLLDVQFFDLRPRGPHLANLLLHAANTLLLFWVLNRTTGATTRSGLVAALFAAHPLHMESVAWISERKDVLSTLFWLATMLAYANYARKPRLSAYLLVCLFLTLGLMSKPMVVTLPFVLLLFDYWPLGRVAVRRRAADASSPLRSTSPGRLALEKTPLLALCAVSGAITFLAQRHSGAVASIEQYPLPLRLGNAVVAYGRYLLKTVWPSDLEVFYPYPVHGVPAWKILLAVAALAAMSVACVHAARRSPYLITGWLWFLGTLVPVIGIVQVGSQAMADRYTYVPHIGLFMAVVWWAARAGRGPGHRPSVAVIAAFAVAIAALSVITRHQLAVWITNKDLFAHAVRIDPGNWVAQTELGLILAEEGKISEGIKHYEAALKANPGYSYTHFNLGVALDTLGRMPEAEARYREALAISPTLAEAHHNLGVIMLRRGRTGEAFSHFSEAVRDKPDFADPHFALGTIFLQQGNAGAAMEHFREAARLQPGNLMYRSNLERALGQR